MIKYTITIIVVVISVAAIFGCSKGYESQKKVGDLTVVLRADRYPLVKADNNLSVKVIDADGKAVTNAKVGVRYYMPPMPGMAPMDFSAQTISKGSVYSFTANTPMEGGWKVDVYFEIADKPIATTTFNIDVR